MKLRYIVNIEYYRFVFETPAEAIDFATKAKLHAYGRRHSNDDVEVRIDIEVANDTENNDEQED